MDRASGTREQPYDKPTEMDTNHPIGRLTEQDSEVSNAKADWSAVAARLGLPDFDGPWVVLHTRSRQEKALAEDLTRLGIPYFLPLLHSVRFYNGRKARVRVPMFPSYLFLRGEMEEAYRAEKTRRLVGIIRVPEPQRLSWELRNLALALTSDATLDPYPNVVRGVRVEVVRGPFMGLQGVVADRTRLDRVHLQVSMLGGGAALELDAALVVPME